MRRGRFLINLPSPSAMKDKPCKFLQNAGTDLNTTRHDNPEDSNLTIHRRETFKPLSLDSSPSPPFSHVYSAFDVAPLSMMMIAPGKRVALTAVR